MDVRADFLEYVNEYPEIQLDENQTVMLHGRCLTVNGKKETWKECAARVAWAGAQATELYKVSKDRTVLSDSINFFDQIYSLKLVPATPVLLNAGTTEQQMFSCFGTVLQDNLQHIYDTLNLSAHIFSKAAGIGFNGCLIRPEGAPVGNYGATATGLIKWMYLNQISCENIKIGAKGRRGAQAMILDYKHPEIFKFIKCKTNPKHFQSFNISVILDKEFFKILQEDGVVTCRSWKGQEPVKYKAAKLWKAFVHQAWLNGEPGALFLDTANKNNPVKHYGDICTVNPCMEIPTVDMGSCNLGSVNIVPFVMETGHFNWEKFRETLIHTVRFLDNLIDVNIYPDGRFKQVEEHIRSIGVSKMGFADALIKMKIKYGSKESKHFAKELTSFRMDICKKESEDIATYRGVAPVFLQAANTPKNLPKRRNAFLCTMAPTGSVSMLAGVSASVEPLFGLVTNKECLGGTIFKYVDKEFVHFLNTKDIDPETRKIIDEHVMQHGTIMTLPKELKRWEDKEVEHFAVAHDINYKTRIEMQEIFQAFTDQAISSTINLPETATEEDISNAFKMAYAKGLKGITVYRNNSRKAQPLNVGQASKNSWVCLRCGQINIETDPDIDPSKVCLRCPTCGAASCSQK